VVTALNISITGLEYFVTLGPIWFNLKKCFIPKVGFISGSTGSTYSSV